MYLLYVYTRSVGLKSLTAPSERAARKKAEDIGRRGFWLGPDDPSYDETARGTFIAPGQVEAITISRMN